MPNELETSKSETLYFTLACVGRRKRKESCPNHMSLTLIWLDKVQIQWVVERWKALKVHFFPGEAVGEPLVDR